MVLFFSFRLSGVLEKGLSELATAIAYAANKAKGNAEESFFTQVGLFCHRGGWRKARLQEDQTYVALAAHSLFS